jgi:dihydroorotate dehydrogenase (fumarate)
MAGPPPPLEINPPLLNSASPWATTLDDLRQLYACSSTGAVTTRTSLLGGFSHDPEKHQYAFFSPAGSGPGLALNASVNSLGYSPLPLQTYLSFIQTISDELPAPSSKGFIVSVTGSPEEVVRCYERVAGAAAHVRFPLAMEVNLSCPNIPGRPPPAYSQEALVMYLEHLQRAIAENAVLRIPVGLKTPPYTHAAEYAALLAALEQAADTDESGACPISFLTATNTLGSCLVFAGGDATARSILPTPDPTNPGAGPELGLGLGGMAGAPLHPLALGNVATLRRLLDGAPPAKLGHVRVVGVGGVLDAAGYRRMRAAGAHAVGLATALGLSGAGVFGEVEDGLAGKW